ncbi:MAG: hypothetical protein ABIR96_12690 [Bdellovibrionota bacterium]
MNKISTLLCLSLFGLLSACGDKQNANLSTQLQGKSFVIESWGCEGTAAPLNNSTSLRYYLSFTDTEIVTLSENIGTASNGGRNEIDRENVTYLADNSIAIITNQGEMHMTVSDQNGKYLLKSVEAGSSVGCSSNQKAQIVLVKGTAFHGL